MLGLGTGDMHLEIVESGGAGAPAGAASRNIDASYALDTQGAWRRGSLEQGRRHRSRGENVLAAVALLSVALLPLSFLRGDSGPSPAGARELGVRELGSSRAVSTSQGGVVMGFADLAATKAAAWMHGGADRAGLHTPKVGAGSSILMQGPVPGKPVRPAGWVVDNSESQGWRGDLSRDKARTEQKAKAAETAAMVKQITAAVRDATDVRQGDAVDKPVVNAYESTGEAEQAKAWLHSQITTTHSHTHGEEVMPKTEHTAGSGREGNVPQSASPGQEHHVASTESSRGMSPLAKALVAHMGKNTATAVMSASDVVRSKALIPSKLSKELTNVISQIVRQAAAHAGDQQADMKRSKPEAVHGGMKSEVSDDGAPVMPEDGEPVPSPLDTAGNFLSKTEKGNLDVGLINATTDVRSAVGGVGTREDESRGWLAYKRIPLTYVAWLCAALCVVITMLTSTKLILRHLDYYANPDTQKYVVRILFMAPIYAVDSLLALTFVGWATTYIDVFRDCYEAFTIYNFLKLLVVLLGGERAVIEMLQKRSQVPLIFPLNWMEPWEMGAELFYSCKYGALQYVLVKPTCALIMFVSGAAGIYGPNSFSLARLHFYVFFFSNVSQMWALYCLVMFYVALREELAPYNPVLKFVIVKAVVFFCFWQGMLLGILAYMGYIGGTADFDSAQIVEAIQELLVCVEMVIVSVGPLSPTRTRSSAPAYTFSDLRHHMCSCVCLQVLTCVWLCVFTGAVSQGVPGGRVRGCGRY